MVMRKVDDESPEVKVVVVKLWKICPDGQCKAEEDNFPLHDYQPALNEILSIERGLKEIIRERIEHEIKSKLEHQK